VIPAPTTTTRRVTGWVLRSRRGATERRRRAST
jgi:hypothetical protein